MDRKYIVALFALIIAGTVCGCSARSSIFASTADSAFLPSGTIILSYSLPERHNAFNETALDEGVPYSPIIGYAPATIGFLPAENELWVEVNRNAKTITIYRGNQVQQSVQGEGSVDATPGQYALQHKQHNPLWYAPDSYFQKRNLEIPPAGHRLRYRRGALGEFALYPTTTFPIHSAPVYDEDVGGLRISRADLATLFQTLPLGATIVVK